MFLELVTSTTIPDKQIIKNRHAVLSKQTKLLICFENNCFQTPSERNTSNQLTLWLYISDSRPA